MRNALSVGVLALLMAGLMCASAWAQPTPDTSFAQTAQAPTDQYTSPTDNGTSPADQGGVKDVTTCSVVVENGRLVRVCRTVDPNGNLVRTTRQDLGPAGGASNALATARGGLPFTGLDLTLVLLVGASLVTAGVVIRTGSRRTRHNRSSA